MMLNVTDVFETKDRWPLRITKINSGEIKGFNPQGTAYVMLNNATFTGEESSFRKINGALCLNNMFTVDCQTGGNGVVIEYDGLKLSENRYYIQTELGMGNLSYMDGGTNTTAINPGRLGDPVINYVHFPAGMTQTLHTHPSHRVGMVLKGRGRVELDSSNFELKPGDVFFMQRNVLHNFTCPYNEDVVLFVFAPDSGTGPTDEVNPLKIRTYVGQQRYAR